MLRSVEELCGRKVWFRCGRERLDGSRCGVVLAEATGDSGFGRLDLKGAYSVVGGVGGLGGTSRPHVVRRSVMPHVRRSALQHVELVERYTWSHPGCRARYTVRMDTLVVAYVRAVRAGARDIYLPL